MSSFREKKQLEFDFVKDIDRKYFDDCMKDMCKDAKQEFELIARKYRITDEDKAKIFTLCQLF